MIDNGISTVMKNVERAMQKKQQGAMIGLRRGVTRMLRVAQQRVPVEYGNLRASGYVSSLKGGFEIGFTAAYAVFVHENMEMVLRDQPRPSGLGVYWGPNGQPKFLESAITEGRAQLLRDIAAGGKAA